MYKKVFRFLKYYINYNSLNFIHENKIIFFLYKIALFLLSFFSKPFFFCWYYIINYVGMCIITDIQNLQWMRHVYYAPEIISPFIFVAKKIKPNNNIINHIRTDGSSEKYFPWTFKHSSTSQKLPHTSSFQMNNKSHHLRPLPL